MRTEGTPTRPTRASRRWVTPSSRPTGWRQRSPTPTRSCTTRGSTCARPPPPCGPSCLGPGGKVNLPFASFTALPVPAGAAPSAKFTRFSSGNLPSHCCSPGTGGGGRHTHTPPALSRRCGPPAVRHHHHLHHHRPGRHWDHIQVLVSGIWATRVGGQEVRGLGTHLSQGRGSGATSPCEVWHSRLPQKPSILEGQGLSEGGTDTTFYLAPRLSPKLGPQSETPASLGAAEWREAAGEPAAPRGPLPHHRQHFGALQRLPGPHA